jgi:uncharacterized peroxidase-related enzyme
MPHIPLEEHLPGITGLLEYRRDTAEPIRDLTQVLMRGPNSLTEGERELIATIVSYKNECKFCTSAHAAVTDVLLGESDTSEQIKKDIDGASISEKMKALLHIAAKVQESGKAVTTALVQRAKNAGATDTEIHDTVLIAALFCLYNRYVDGLATIAPTDPTFYETLASRISKGYLRQPHGYDHLKNK